MKNSFLFISLLGFLLLSCNPSNKEKTTKHLTIRKQTNKQEKTTLNQLTIEGENIWVREKPFTGKVIMKLNTGDICEVLDKSEEAQVRDRLDYWYKIKFNNKIGWVFGSQTNLKTNKIIQIEDFATFLKRFIPQYHKKNFNNFIHKDIGSQIIHNPGVFCILDKSDKRPNISFTSDINFTNIYNYKPNGDFCEGYPKVKDGFYYWKSNYSSFPSYADMKTDPDIISKKVEIPNKYVHNTIYQVQVITNEYLGFNLYFINIGEHWYLTLEDYCDCSA